MSNQTILVVDDTPANLQVLGQILSKEKYKIIFAFNGEQALKSLEHQIPDLVLLDVNMPEMDGFETCNRMKQLELLNNVPILFLTARTDIEDIVNAFKIGGADYITKPFNPTELLARIHFHLSLKEKTEQLKEINDKNKALIRVLLHDLLNPIGAIKSANELILEGDDESHAMSNLIQRAVENCLTVLDSVRKMYRIDEKQYTPNLTSVNLLDSIQFALTILTHKLSEKNIKINLDISNDIQVLVDEGPFINSVFNNLLTNAIKFSFPNSEISIKAICEKDFIVLSIKDTG
ncbi:MAG TPA: hybrid sensor histidine kinase/response regulator, partial [Leptospiraceae bacterium]|nr:hybrid sensor histidine kinase/response regulator [Leptospiraceae bacterium]